MKKNYKTRIKGFVVLLALLTFSMSAQLNGVYTINKTAPVSASNFTSFTDAAAVWNSLGVTGPVTINVVANTGPYTEQVQFNQATGVTATNSMLINGNGNTITFASSNSAQAWTILLQGADYMAINNLTVTGTGTYAYAVMLVGGADYNRFTNIYFGVPANATSSSQIPVVLSGANSTYASAANSGNYNTFDNCTIFSGYFGISHYGITGSPYNTNNTFTTCVVTDWYVYGIYAYYSKNLTVAGCRIDRPTRSIVTTTYPMYIYYNQGAMIEKNRIVNLWGGAPGNTNGSYFYLYYTSLTGVGPQQNTYQNNIYDPTGNGFNGYLMFYIYYFNGFFQHNTCNYDNPNYNYTGTVYGAYIYGAVTSYPITFRNNIITMNLGGASGTRYATYYVSSSGVTSNYNNVINFRSIGTNSLANNYHSYYNGNWYNLTQLQAQSTDLNSTMMDPMYLNPSSNLPSNYLPTNNSLNNLGLAVGVTNDCNNQVRATIPDMGALEFLNTPCSGAPALTSVLTPTAVQCPSVNLQFGFASAYTLANMSFQWMSSNTSSVGPWTSISNATNQALAATNITVNTWYTASVTCNNGGSGINTNAGLVQIAGTTTNTAPYYESFEGISAINRLPNCSWYSANLGGSLGTYTNAQNNSIRYARTGSNYAAYYYSPGGINNCYSNGIYLNAGVTYSGSVWYMTDYYGYQNWSDMTLLVCPAQSAVNNTVIASSNGVAVSPNSYKSLSATFTVGTSGLYYINVRGTSNAACCGYYLVWDDLKIEIPCQANPTSISVAASNSVICSGQSATLTATGGANYMWNTGATSSSIVVTPNGNTNYQVTALGALTGCSTTASQNITVNQSPNVSIFTPNGAVCKGSTTNLSAFGATNYNWSNSSTGPMISVSPSVNTSYTVIGTNANGCSGSAVQAISVNNLPSINPAAVNVQMCVNESNTLSATGALSYTWSSQSILIQGANVVVSPVSTTTYVVSGTDASGCVGSSNLVITVNGCVGLNELNNSSSVKLYPNPTKADVNIEFSNELTKTITVTDVMGRIVLTNTTASKNTNLGLSTLANGVYYVKVDSNSKSEVIKVVKQ